ncbi:MAG: preprotein translocase subunit YajC [Lachnospirales bacterium]
MSLLVSFLLTQGGEVATKASDTIEHVTQVATEAANGAASSSSGGFGIWGMVLYIVFFIAIFYLLIIKPQKKKDKQLKEMQAAISIGDDVMTSSGFFGTVVDINDEVATVEFGTNKGVRIPVKKSEIYTTKSANKANDTEKK